MTDNPPYTIKLDSPAARAKALEALRRAPEGYVLTLMWPKSKRTTQQNKLMWDLLGQLAKKTTYHGYRLTKEEWKMVILSGLRKEMRMVPSLNNDGVVSLSRTSELKVAEMAAMIELIEAYAAGKDVKLVRRTEPGTDELQYGTNLSTIDPA